MQMPTTTSDITITTRLAATEDAHGHSDVLDILSLIESRRMAIVESAGDAPLSQDDIREYMRISELSQRITADCIEQLVGSILV